MALSRPLAAHAAVLAAVSELMIGCAHRAAPPPAHSSTSNTPAAAPAPRVCVDPPAAPATLNLRDKLAQLLMVGVKNADDARNVVNGYHVGGIFIGSWTDLTIFRARWVTSRPRRGRCRWRSASTRRAAGSRG